MVWHIKKTSMIGVGTVYYKGDNRWTDTYADRSTYSVSYTHLTLPTIGEV